MTRSRDPSWLLASARSRLEPRAVPGCLVDAAENPAGSPSSRFARSGGDGVGWEDGGMPDAIPPVDLASLAGGGGHPGARWRLDGEDLQANLVRLGQGDRIQGAPAAASSVMPAPSPPSSGRPTQRAGKGQTSAPMPPSPTIGGPFSRRSTNRLGAATRVSLRSTSSRASRPGRAWHLALGQVAEASQGRFPQPLSMRSGSGAPGSGGRV